MTEITRSNTEGQIKLIWKCLDDYRELRQITEQDIPEKEWDEICTAMSWISEDLDVDLSDGEIE